MTTKRKLTALILAASWMTMTQAGLLVQETFSGSSEDVLNGTAADTFDSAITTAGGDNQWLAINNSNTAFKADGSVVNSSTFNGAASLNLGSYVNDAKGQANGIFELSLSLNQPVKDWFSIGFSTEETPSTGSHFGQTGSGGIATMIYRTQGEIDYFAGPGTANGLGDGTKNLSGPQTMTVQLDLSGHDGTSNFGTVRYFIGSSTTPEEEFTYTAQDYSFNSILITVSNGESGSMNDLSFSQIPEPTSIILMLTGLLGLVFFKRKR